jgi:hypothetical protein
VFGTPGTPQRWIDILGSVSDLPASSSVRFVLNGKDRGVLGVGPDGYRLQSPGDFDAQISIADPALVAGRNQVAISVVDGSGAVQASRSMSFTWTSGNRWPLPYVASWGAGPQTAARVVDGYWEVVPGGLRSTRPGYDRLVAIGDVTWTDYRVTVPVTLNSLSTATCDCTRDGGPAVGLLLRWDGHEQEGSPTAQPAAEPWPFGAIGVFHWNSAAPGSAPDRFELLGSPRYENVVAADRSGRRMTAGTTWTFSMEVATLPGGESRYRFKAWPGTGADPTPGVWDLETIEGQDASDPASGSLLLLAHHVDATFGTVTVMPAGEQVGLVDGSSGQWHVRTSGGAEVSFYYGTPGDVPIVGDWDCDGVDTPGAYRQSNGFVYLRNSNTTGPGEVRFFLGNPGDVPLAGDFDGDGCDTVGVYRPSEGRVFLTNVLGANDGFFVAQYDFFFGNPGDKPFVGDFNKDGVDTVGLHRESSGYVYFRNSNTQGVADAQFFFGNPGDRLVAGDWNRDGVDTVAIYRPSTASFYFTNTNTQGVADSVVQFGNAAWLPVAGALGLG